MSNKNIKRIAKLITEDPDIFNENYEEPDDPKLDYAAMANDPDIVRMLRKKMLTNEEQREAEFEEEKAARREIKSLQRSMEQEYIPPVKCDQVRKHLDTGVENISNESLYEHLWACPDCQEYKDDLVVKFLASPEGEAQLAYFNKPEYEDEYSEYDDEYSEY